MKRKMAEYDELKKEIDLSHVDRKKLKTIIQKYLKMSFLKRPLKKILFFTNQNMLTNYIQKEKKMKKQNHC